MVKLICSLNLVGCNAALGSAGWAGWGRGRALTFPSKWDRVKEEVKFDCKEPAFETGLVKKTAHCPCKWAAPGNKMTLCCCFLIHLPS